MGTPPRVRCGKVELRLVTPRAAHGMFSLARDPAVSEQLQWAPHERVDDSLEFIHDARRLWQSGSAWLPGIFDHEREQLVGCTGLSGIDRANQRAEAGTWIGVPFQGRGYNLPSKAALVTAAFRVLGLARVEFLVRTDNPRSLTALRRLPGIREEGVLADRIVRDGVAHDAVLLALLARDFDPALWPEVQVLEPASRPGVGAAAGR